MQPRLSELTREIKANRAAARRSASQAFVRAAAVTLLSKGRHIGDVMKRHWPNDTATEIVLKAASAPANSSTSGWAQELVGMGVADFIGTLGPASAAAMLFSRGMQFIFDGTGHIFVNGITAAAGNADFVQDGKPIPVRKFDTAGGIVLEPRKLATISVFSREALEHTTPNVELLVRQVLSESVGLQLDAKVFDAVAGDEIRPKGLLNGINAGTASISTVPSEAMSEDVGTLVGAVAAVAGNNPVTFVASPKQATALRMWARPNFNYEVLSSSALADKTVIVIASNALVSAIDPAPRFDVTENTSLHFEDATPRDIDSTAVAATVKSLYQSDLIGLRIIMQVSWGLRSDSGLAWLENVLW